MSTVAARDLHDCALRVRAVADPRRAAIAGLTFYL